MKTNHKLRLTAAVLILCMVSMLFIPGNTESIYAKGIDFLILGVYEKSLDVGDEFYISAVASNGNKITFRSSNSKVASVSPYGRIIAKKPGEAKITVKAGKAQARCRIIVKKTRIDVNEKNISMDNGSTFQLKAAASTGHGLTYKSSKKSVAAVDEKGLITAKKPGEANITISVDGVSEICKIKVRETKVRLDRTKATLYRKGEITLSVSTNSKTEPKWKSNKSSVATVDNKGNVTAVKHGTATITVTIDGVKATCEILVKQPGVSFPQSELTLKQGEKICVKAKVSSGNEAVYSSSNTTVATVDEQGNIYACGKGKAYIYATEDGIKAKMTIRVK
ncbi:MAG: Ig-like domain-containing protein [Lachnobacterium sp.]|uniref:Ig-like domain-containing protein n=1 Tax=Agathobacter sp. TaxID=2021311 RepID=UPI003039E89D|nr:Ig-like domain-containing protein [Lachnobacterium sp.]